MKKFTIIILIIILAMSSSFACTKQETTQQAGSTTTKATTAQTTTKATTSEEKLGYLNMEGYRPVVSEGTDVSLTMLTVMHDTLGQGDPNKTWWAAFVEQIMNVDLEIEAAMQSASKEKQSLLFAAGNLPDLIVGFGMSTTDLVRYGQLEGQLLALNDYIDAYMPALLALQGDFPTMLANCAAPDGQIYSFPRLLSYKDPGHVAKFFVNMTWLDALQMDKPETLDDFYDMLVAFKTEDPGNLGQQNVIPLGGSFALNDPSANILSAYGFVTVQGYKVYTPMLRNGEVEIAAGSELYKEFLKFMNQCYTEELMSKDFYTLDSTQTNALMAAGYVGVWREAPYLALPEYEDYDQYQALKPLTSEFNKTPVVGSGNPVSVGNWSVSAKCQYPEVVARLVDFFYTEEGTPYAFDGPVKDSPDLLLEGLDPNIMKGWLWDPEKNSQKFFAEEDGSVESSGIYIRTYVIPFHTSMIGNRSDVANARRVASGFAPITELKYDLTTGEGNFRDTVTKEILPYVTDTYPFNVYFTEEETERINELKTVIINYIDTETAKFITGVNSLDKIDQYYTDLENLGFYEYEQFYKDAYASYLSSLEN